MKRRKFIRQSSLLGSAAAFTPVAALHARSNTGSVHADLIIKRARIYTMDDSLPLAESVAVTGNRILAVGSNN